VSHNWNTLALKGTQCLTVEMVLMVIFHYEQSHVLFVA